MAVDRQRWRQSRSSAEYFRNLNFFKSGVGVILPMSGMLVVSSLLRGRGHFGSRRDRASASTQHPIVFFTGASGTRHCETHVQVQGRFAPEYFPGAQMSGEIFQGTLKNMCCSFSFVFRRKLGPGTLAIGSG